MSVEALVPVGEKAPAAPGKPVSLLRSGDAKALPDSMIRVIDGENYLKFVYAYTDEGALSLMTAIRWDADAASWAGEKTYSEAYTYDENGRLTRSVREDVLDDGTISAGTTTNTYDQHVRRPGPLDLHVFRHGLPAYDGYLFLRGRQRLPFQLHRYHLYG